MPAALAFAGVKNPQLHPGCVTAIAVQSSTAAARFPNFSIIMPPFPFIVLQLHTLPLKCATDCSDAISITWIFLQGYCIKLQNFLLCFVDFA